MPVPRHDSTVGRSPTRQDTHTPQAGTSRLLLATNRWLAVAIAASLCLSGLQFCLYIALRYLGPLFTADTDQRYRFAPGFSNDGDAAASTSLVLHLVTGAIVMVLGGVQLITAVRRRWPVVHRWMGRGYVGLAMLTAVGGLGYIVLNGTVGGVVMDVGFGLYGVLVLLAAAQCLRYARSREFHLHREWAVRLFVLVMASWLYRLEYGISGLLDIGGRNPSFTGWFDQMMAFAFYLPSLVVVELYLRASRTDASTAPRVASLLALLGAASVVAVGVYTQW